MKPLLGYRQLSIESAIVRAFGVNEVPRSDKCLFDQITLSEAWAQAPVSALMRVACRLGSVLVLFDRNPDNIRLTMCELQRLNLPLVSAAK